MLIENTKNATEILHKPHPCKSYCIYLWLSLYVHIYSALHLSRWNIKTQSRVNLHLTRFRLTFYQTKQNISLTLHSWRIHSREGDFRRQTLLKKILLLDVSLRGGFRSYDLGKLVGNSSILMGCFHLKLETFQCCAHPSQCGRDVYLRTS